MRKLLLFIFFTFITANSSFAVLGDAGEPAKSCYHIKQQNPNATDGRYFLQSPSMTQARKFYCDMTRDGGGWTLLFQRRGGFNRNTETCGQNLNDFLQNTCGRVNRLGQYRSYSSGVGETLANFSQKEYLVKQWYFGEDTDDGYIIHSTENLFPDTLDIENIVVSKICDKDNTNCDTTDTYWKYAGTSWFPGAYCSAGKDGSTQYKGNYGYCHNGLSYYLANGLFGNRNGYSETKLWDYGSSSQNYNEQVFFRSYEGSIEELNISNTDINIGQNGSGVVGTLSSIEIGYIGNFTYTIVQNDDNLFSISGNTLSITNNSKENYTVKIRTTDDTGLFLEKTFTFTNVNFIGGSGVPITSCSDLKNSDPSAPSGVYWMKNNQITTPKKVYCEMDINGGGWTLLFQRRGGQIFLNREKCGTSLNNFLQNTCGDTYDLGFDKSYSIDVDDFLSKVTINSYMVTQYGATMTVDSDDAYTLTTNENIFPNDTTGLKEYNISQICNINSTNCDSTDVIWKYTGTSRYHSALCNANNYAGSTSYRGNYGYCHNGHDGSASSRGFGDRSSYSETKLWGHPNGGNNYMERVFVKIVDQVQDSTPPTITSATPNDNDIFVGDSIKIDIAYTDDVEIDPNGAGFSLQKWNPTTNNYENISLTTLNQNVTTTNATYEFSGLTYGKYKYIFSIRDTSGNTQTIEKTFYIDYPIVTINKSEYNFGNVIPGIETTSDDITITVQTVGGTFSIIANNQQNPSYNIHTFENWTGLLGYAIQKPNEAWKVFTNETIGSEVKNINTNGEYNTYTYTFNLKLKLNSQQVAGEYEGLFGIDAIFTY